MNIEQAMTPNVFDSVTYLKKYEKVENGEDFYATVLESKENYEVKAVRLHGTNTLSVLIVINKEKLADTDQPDGWLAEVLAERLR